MTSMSVSARSRVRLLLRYLDARLVRRRYCESCMKPTVLDHRHTVRFECVIRREWRDS